MTALRRTICALAAILLAGCVVAQELVPFVTGFVPSPVADTARIHVPPDAPAQAKWSAWFCYGDARFDFRDHRSWIEDLAKTRREQGLEVVVAMPEAAARELAAQESPFSVAALDLFVGPGSGAATICMRERGSVHAPLLRGFVHMPPNTTIGAAHRVEWASGHVVNTGPGCVAIR